MPLKLLSPDTSAEDVLSGYSREIERADEIIAATPLDAAPAWWPDFFGSYRLDDLQQVMLHVITETACHAGHLDAVLLDVEGRTPRYYRDPVDVEYARAREYLVDLVLAGEVGGQRAAFLLCVVTVGLGYLLGAGFWGLVGRRPWSAGAR